MLRSLSRKVDGDKRRFLAAVGRRMSIKGEYGGKSLAKRDGNPALGVQDSRPLW
jgi:hypothetical protein